MLLTRFVALAVRKLNNKIVCKSMAQVLMHVIMLAANAAQKRFISGRHFTDNILFVDTVMRVYSNLYKRYGKSVAAFFDFSNAFPSVALQWIFLVLRWLRMPRGIRNFFMPSNTMCNVSSSMQGWSTTYVV